MVKMIDIIEEYCEFRSYSCARLDGRISGNDRQKSIDNFNKDPNSFVFLLSTRAGGVGINLTAADTVIIFDSDWNPQNDIQAMARCHRIGQSKSVKIYRLITRRSFEYQMFERASKKLGLEQAVLGTRNFNDIDFDDTKSNNMDAKDMERLLRDGAYSVLLEDDSEAVKEFYEQDIEKILEHHSHVLVENANAPTESWLNKRKKLGATSKRAFTGDSAKEHAEIDVDDPDFWKKVLPDLVTPDSMFDRLNDNSLDDDEDGEAITKYMKDLASMMDGMVDLSRRNQLPEHERAVCLKLLIRLTLKDDIFDDIDRTQAQEWLSVIEGTRSRRGRGDIYQVEDHRKASSGRGKGRGGRGSGRGSGRGRGRGRPRFDDDEIEEEDDDDEDDEEEEIDLDDEFNPKYSNSKSGRGSGRGRGRGRGGSTEGGRGRGRGRGKSHELTEFIPETLTDFTPNGGKSPGRGRGRSTGRGRGRGRGSEQSPYIANNELSETKTSQSEIRGGKGRTSGRGRGRSRVQISESFEYRDPETVEEIDEYDIQEESNGKRRRSSKSFAQPTDETSSSRKRKRSPKDINETQEVDEDYAPSTPQLSSKRSKATKIIQEESEDEFDETVIFTELPTPTTTSRKASFKSSSTNKKTKSTSKSATKKLRFAQPDEEPEPANDFDIDEDETYE